MLLRQIGAKRSITFTIRKNPTGGNNMATPTHPEIQSQQVSCSICHKEIPLSAALTPQGADYVGHFCGIECYDQFAAQKKPGAPEKTQK